MLSGLVTVQNHFGSFDFTHLKRIMKAHLMPIGKGTRSPLKGPSRLTAAVITADGSSSVGPAATALSSSSGQPVGSDRARIAVLKSDIGLVQVEIDAFRGDPGGLLELQSVLERFQWNPDAHLNWHNERTTQRNSLTKTQ